jgi:hypothetical protein
VGLGAEGLGAGGSGGGSPWQPLKVDQTSNKTEKGLLRNAFKTFAGSNCDKVFGKVIAGYATGIYEAEALAANFYNETDPNYSGLTQSEVTNNGVDTTLANAFTGPYEDATAITIGLANPAVLLGAEFFSNANTVFQTDVLLHEALHVLTGWSDQTLFSKFAQYGLNNPSQYADTEYISAWISTDCNSTPTSFARWNK